jgi:hypothetical protein
MSGIVFSLHNQVSWQVKNTEFWNILEPARDRVEKGDLKNVLDHAVETGALELSSLSAPHVLKLFELFQQELEELPRDRFTSDEAYSRHQRLYRGLLGLLAQDPRVASPLFVQESRDPLCGIVVPE